MNIRRRMAKGAAWMISLRFFMRTVGIASTIILARLLSPEDFGLVAMATMIMGLVLMFSEMNVEAVLIQRSEIDDSYLDGAFGLKVLIAMSQALVLAALANPIAGFYSEPRLEAIVYALALAVLAGGLTNIGIVEFQRAVRFHQEVVMRAVPKLMAFVVTVAIAAAYQSYWALVAGTVVNQAGRTVLSYLLHPYRPRPSISHWSEIFRFSKWLVLNQGLGFLSRRGSDLVLGRIVGARSVGLFSVAHQIATLPTTELVAPINRAVFSGYSRMSEATGELRAAYLDVAGMIALVAVPAGLGIAVASPTLIPLLLGEQWDDAIPLVRVLAIAGAISVLTSNSYAAFLALGRPYITTVLNGTRLVLLIPGAIYGAQVAGAWGVALAYLLATSCMFPITLATTLRVLAVRLSEFAHVVHRPLLAAAVMYALVEHLSRRELPALDLPLPLEALLVVFVGAVTYAALVLAMWHLAGRPAGAERRALRLAGANIARLLPRQS